MLLSEGLLSHERYAQPWHASKASCQQHGCMKGHVMLQDFCPRAASGDRNKLRNAVRAGKLVGTKNVPKPDEAGVGSMRTSWWWHEDDPALALAKKLVLGR